MFIKLALHDCHKCQYSIDSSNFGTFLRDVFIKLSMHIVINAKSEFDS